MTLQLQLRHVFSTTSGATPDSGNPEFWDGDIPWATPEDVSAVTGYWLEDTRRRITHAGYVSCGTRLAPAKSIVLTKRAPIGQLAILATEACSNQGCFLLTPRNGPDARFFYYWLCANSGWLQILGRGSTFMELSTDDLKSLKVPLPSLVQQEAIADFLDRETARLDALVAAKGRLLGLLAEKRRALITRAVTRGLDADAPLRDSGLPWLGQIPTHWHTRRLKFLVRRIDQGWSPECHNVPAVKDEWGVLKAGCCNGGVFNPTENKSLPGDLEPPPQLEIIPGDILMSRASGSVDLIGSVAVVPQGCPSRLVLSDKIYRFHLEAGCADPGYFATALASGVGRVQIQRVVSGAEGLANNIAQSDIREFVLPLPPLGEQRAIVAHIASETAKLDALRAAAERTIVLLKERRAALIAGAVTDRVSA